MLRQASADREVPDRAVLSRGEVHVWRATLDPKPPLGASPSPLSEVERSRAEGYRFERDRRRFRATRVLLRRLLSAYAEVSPAELEFDVTCRFCGGPHGKPRLVGAEPDFDFSLSYAGDAFLLAVSAAGPVGVDVEAPPSPDCVEDLLAAAATAAESGAVRALEAEDRGRALARLWTLKEAVLKATGHGLAVDPRAIELARVVSATPRLASVPPGWPDASRWHLRSLESGGRYAAALALTRPPVAIATRQLGHPPQKEQKFPSS